MGVGEAGRRWKEKNVYFVLFSKRAFGIKSDNFKSSQTFCKKFIDSDTTLLTSLKVQVLEIEWISLC